MPKRSYGWTDIHEYNYPMGLAKILENIMLNFCKGMYCWILVVDLVVD